MKIFIDINHPAHVHYFRNFVGIMKKNGHEFCVVNRDSKIINQLLDYYCINHIIRNKRPNKPGILFSAIYFFKALLWNFSVSFKYRPDMYIGFASASCAIIAWFFRKPSILLDDSDFNRTNHRIIGPFASVILTPFYFDRDLKYKKNGYSKQIRFNAFIEQLYLHSSFFCRNNVMLEELNIKPKGYVLVRFSAYNAYHDVDLKPLSKEGKKRIVLELSKHYKVLVSMEENSSDTFFTQYSVLISPEKMHDLEASARFMITEGLTMASESFVHGVPYICINPLQAGNIDWQCLNYPDMAFKALSEDEIYEVINKISENFNDDEKVRIEIEKNTINPTPFLVWFVENYPNSSIIMHETPDYQWTFR